MKMSDRKRVRERLLTKREEQADGCLLGEMTKTEELCAIMYLPVHMFLIPAILTAYMEKGSLDGTDANIICYAAALLFVLATERKYLRREFDPLCDNLKKCAVQIILCYAVMMILNLCISGVLSWLAESIENIDAVNQNNEAIIEMTKNGYGKIRAIGVFMAPISEEVMFRGGIFRSLRKRSRIMAYCASMAAFSIYHVWTYAVNNPVYWIFVVEYLPASFVLCRSYEKTDTIWSPIFLHMLINDISLKTLAILGEYF